MPNPVLDALEGGTAFDGLRDRAIGLNLRRSDNHGSGRLEHVRPFGARTVSRVVLGAIVAAAGVAVALVAWLDDGGEDAVARAVPLPAGRALYEQHCARCHGADLEGQPNWRERLPSGRLPAPPHDESGHTWHHPDPLLFAMTKEGTAALAPPGYESDMPGFGDNLSDDEILGVLDYIKSTWPAAVRARQADISARFSAQQGE